MISSLKMLRNQKNRYLTHVRFLEELSCKISVCAFLFFRTLDSLDDNLSLK